MSARSSLLETPLDERPPFLTIRVGTLKTEAELRQSVLVGGCLIDIWGNDMMKQHAFTAGIAQVEEDVDFIIASADELGYPDGCDRAQALEAGLRMGWRPCLPSDGPEIRRNLNEEVGEWSILAMDSIMCSDGCLRVFFVAHHDRGLIMDGYDCDSGNILFWRGACLWMFRSN